jgi:hypothetical protein
MACVLANGDSCYAICAMPDSTGGMSLTYARKKSDLYGNLNSNGTTLTIWKQKTCAADMTLAGRDSMRTARGVVAELPRSTRLGPASGLWHVIPAAGENLRVHRRFFNDIQTADAAA